jgi:hypothetical protein
MEGWKKSNTIFDEPTFTPSDTIRYFISSEVIRTTELVLREYGNLQPSSEGIVYWGGRRIDKNVEIMAVIAPNARATRRSITVDHRANMEVVDFLTENELVHLGQVHTHPEEWVGHSIVDDESAAFRCNGLLSLVVPNFCNSGMTPLTLCGVHRYTDGKFIRLSKTYTNSHFVIYDSSGSIIYKDLRHEL